MKLNKIYLLIITLLFLLWIQPESFLFFVVLTLQVYILGNLIFENIQNNKEEKKTKRLWWLAVSCTILVGSIFYYKLFPLIGNTDFGKSFYGENFKIIIPIGLSFLIFTSISYLTDIYRKDAPAGNLLDTALYLLFFPKILSGPIVLWKDFHRDGFITENSSQNIWEGLQKICIGYAKKVIIADTLGMKISQLSDVMHMGDLSRFSSETLSILPQTDIPMYWICALLYMFQIYFDFSGYSDIAIGLCKVFGINIKENFNFPYVSKTVGEFWRRWHISLGTWFKEYVYIPLGGNRKGNVYFNLFIVFLLTGIWHGIGWTFLLWGIINGIAVIVERFCKNIGLSKYIPSFLGHIYIPIFLYFSWLLFSSYDLSQFVDYLKNMIRPLNNGELNFTWQYYFDRRTIMIVLIAAGGSFLGEINFIKQLIDTKLQNFKPVCCLLLFVVSLLFVINSSYSPFIYFQF
ncbi:MAG: MBOAT family protein [Bacteroidales bacterium]|nr:MBOAT family protein [Bacteroidales bacterium]